METKVLPMWVKFKYNERTETLTVSKGISVSITKLDKQDGYEVNCLGEKQYTVPHASLEDVKIYATEKLRNKLQEAMDNIP